MKVSINKIKKLILYLFILIISLVYFYRLKEHPLQDDEHAATRKSPIIFQEYFNLNFDKQFWTSYIAYDHPSLSFLIYGLVDTIVYRTSWDKLLESVDFTSYVPLMDSDYYGPGVWWTYCINKINPLLCIPTEFYDAYNLIVLNRYVSVTLAILTLILVYMIGSEISGFFLGILSLILLALHPVFYNHARHALLDIPFLFFELLLFYSLIKIFNKNSNFLSYKRTLLISLVCGLVASVKINGFMFPVIVSTIYVVFFLRQNKNKQLVSLSNLVFHIFLINFLSFLVFIIFNPFLWFGSSPYNNLIFMYQWREHETGLLSIYFPEASYLNIFLRPSMIVQNLLLNKGCCKTFLHLSSIFDAFFFISGFIFLVRSKNSQCKLVLMMFLGIFISMVFYLKLDFDRYFLPIIPFVVLIQSVGVVFLLKRIYITYSKTLLSLFKNIRIKF